MNRDLVVTENIWNPILTMASQPRKALNWHLVLGFETLRML